MTTVIRSARCLCGAVQLSLTGEPIFMGYCHCSSCTRWVGGPLHASALWHGKQVQITKGADHLVTFARTEDSENLRRFCKTCGSPVMNHHPTANWSDVPARSISELTFTPTAHTHYGERTLRMRDGLPKYKYGAPIAGGSDLLPE